MNYPAPGKLEVIRPVKQSALGVRPTLDKLGIPRAAVDRRHERVAHFGVAQHYTLALLYRGYYVTLYNMNSIILDNILSINLMSFTEISQAVADRCRTRRLALGYTREQIAARAGVSSASLKRFERTGHIAFSALISLAIALDATEGLDVLFAKKSYESLEEVIARPTRQRGRRRDAQ